MVSKTTESRVENLELRGWRARAAVFSAVLWLFTFNFQLSTAICQSQPYKVANLNNIRYADQFPGADAGAKIAAAIADLPATGGTVDARGLEGAQAISTDIFAGVTKPGTLLLGSANFSVTATQNVPSHWTIRGQHAPVLGIDPPEGTVFTWAGAIDSTVLRYFDTEFSYTEGVAVNCNSVAGCRGILIDSDNAPQAFSNRFQNITLKNGDILLGIGTSGITGYASAGIEFRNFYFENPTTAAVRINSQNAIQTSIFEGGYVRIPVDNSAADGFDVRDAAGNPGFSPGAWSIRRVSFGASQIGYTGAAIEFSTANGLSGGAPLEIAGCDFEIPSSSIAASPGGLVRSSNVVTVTTTGTHNFQNGATVVISGSTSVGGTSFDGAFVITSVTPPSTFTYAQVAADDTGGGGVAATGFAFRSTTNEGQTGTIELRNNTFAISAIYIAGTRRVVSIGNSFTGQNSPYFSPATTIARVTSIGDTFNYGRWNVPAATTPLVELNRVTVGLPFQAPIHVTAIPDSSAGILAESSTQNPIGLRLLNTSAAPSDWRLIFPGTGGASPGDFVLRDGINARNVLVASKATGAVGVGPSVNGYTSPGDLSVGRNANSGGVFFSTGTQALLDYGVTAPGKFNFSGGPVQAVATSTSVNVVTFSATPTFDASLGNTQKITLTGNVTSSTLSNAATGQQINFLICQDATGGRTFTWPANVLGSMTIGSTASTCSAQNFIFDGTNAYALSLGVTSM
jgi:hypothetical protein